MECNTRYMHLIKPAGGARNPTSSETSIEYEDADGNMRTENNVYMNGPVIMEFALREVPKTIEAVLKESGWRKEDVGTFALHHANKFVVEHPARKMKLEPESVPLAIADTGNTGPASIPLLLTLQYPRSNSVSRLKKVVMCGFGIGFSWGAVTAELSHTIILPPVEL